MAYLKQSFVSFALLLVLGSCQIFNFPTHIGFINHPIRGVIQISWSYTGDLVAYDADIIYGTIAEFNQVLINITYPSTNSSSPPPPAPSTCQRTRRRRRGHLPHVKRSNSVFPGSFGQK